MRIQQILSENMKRLRKKSGMTQAVLAERIESSTSYIAEIETMKKFPSPSKMEDIASALNVEPYELIMPFSKVIGSDSKKTLTYKITEEIRFALDNIENQLTSGENSEAGSNSTDNSE